MSDNPVESLALDPHIAMLRFYIAHLPESLPNPVNSTYNFSSFVLEDNMVEEIGEIQAIDKELHARLGPRKGLKLKERGLGVQALVNRLEEWTRMANHNVILEKPGNLHGEILIEKWIFALLQAAEDAFDDAGVLIPYHKMTDCITHYYSGHAMDLSSDVEDWVPAEMKLNTSDGIFEDMYLSSDTEDSVAAEAHQNVSDGMIADLDMDIYLSSDAENSVPAEEELSTSDGIYAGLDTEICLPSDVEDLEHDGSSNSAENQNLIRHSAPQFMTSSQSRAVEYFNYSTAQALQALTGCTDYEVDVIFNLRPYHSIDDVYTRLPQAGGNLQAFDDTCIIFQGYSIVDDIVEECQQVGASLQRTIASWPSGETLGKTGLGNTATPAMQYCSIHADLEVEKIDPAKDFIVKQPSALAKGTALKDYQLYGLNWLNLLYLRKCSCILADDMGLGKTIQVISFFAHLKEQGNKGPHLLVVLPSILENWLREFQRFAPSLSTVTYHGNKTARYKLRKVLLENQASTSRIGGGWEILITTYGIAHQGEHDRKFLGKIKWNASVFDEGHMLKNLTSKRYTSLIRYSSQWRLLLTGTPIQNNLQEVVSLMNFILSNYFRGATRSLHAIFKTEYNSEACLLAEERVSRAREMMAPFVLRRRKEEVIKELPKKNQRIEWCELNDTQTTLYHTATLPDGKGIIADATVSMGHTDSAKGSNVLMNLRKASLHPMLFRTQFSEQMLQSAARVLMKQNDIATPYELILAELQVMTDAELQMYFTQRKVTRRFLLSGPCYNHSGKIKVLLPLIRDYIGQRRKILIFSQFTTMIDILGEILKEQRIGYLVLTGSTPINGRQSIVDEFTMDKKMKLPVFLLSTKAGGLGINLTAASVVIIFDQDFNPHNDKQAQDRAYRIGQKSDVDVITLITRNTIEEDMLKTGQTKLALDDAVSRSTEHSRFI